MSVIFSDDPHGQAESYILHNNRPLTTTLNTLLSIRACIRVSCYTGSLLANRFMGAIGVVIVWYQYLQLPVQSVPITTKVVSSNPARGEVYSIQHFVIKMVSDLRHVGDFW
jgi:hypothetical protein